MAGRYVELITECFATQNEPERRQRVCTEFYDAQKHLGSIEYC